jgi:hypothetical protein
LAQPDPAPGINYDESLQRNDQVQFRRGNMRSHRTAAKLLLSLLVLFTAALSFAVSVRGSSGNGEDSNAPSWMLLGRSISVPLTANGKKATMTQEVICINQDVEASLGSPTLSLAGSCDSGVYMHLFQYQSIALNVGVAIGRLNGFNPTNSTDYGVLICDSPSNTIEMCTNDPTGTHIPNMTITTTKTSVLFTVPNTFPSYPAGTAQQGQGLTFYVITRQSTPLPLAVPTAGIR